MPIKPKKACQFPGCPKLADKRYCPEHIEHARRERKKDTRPGSSDRGYDWQWAKYARAFVKRNPFCKLCGAPSVVCDHIVPLRIMGKNTYDDRDYQALCVSCNTLKGKNEDKTEIIRGEDYEGF